jgi:uncharacterized membrane protein
MWFEGLTLRGVLVIMMFTLNVLVFIFIVMYPWFKKWYINRHNKNKPSKEVKSEITFPPDFIDPEQFLREMQP